MRRRVCALPRRRRDGALASRPVCAEDARGRCRWGGSEKESFSSTRRAFLAVVVVAVVDVRVAALGPRKTQTPKTAERDRGDCPGAPFTRHLVSLSSPGPTEKERGRGAHLIHVAPAFHACASSSRKRPRLAAGACKVTIPPCRRRRHRHHRRRRGGGGGASAGAGDCLSSAVVQLLLLSNVSDTGGVS